MSNLRDQLERAIAAKGRPSSDFDLNKDGASPGGALRDAAVMVPIVLDRSVPQLILTKRSSALKHHPG